MDTTFVNIARTQLHLYLQNNQIISFPVILQFIRFRRVDYAL